MSHSRDSAAHALKYALDLQRRTLPFRRWLPTGTSHITICLIICFLLGSLHRRTVRASVIVDREQGQVVQQQTDIEYLKPACHSTGNALLRLERVELRLRNLAPVLVVIGVEQLWAQLSKRS
jgi:hypothetical protein